MNFKLNPRNKLFHISTSTKRFPSTNSLQEYWNLYVPSKFMFSCHSNHKCGLGQKKVYIFDCPQQGTGRPEISNQLLKQSVQAGKGCHTSERSQSKSECIRWWPARWVSGTTMTRRRRVRSTPWSSSQVSNGAVRRAATRSSSMRLALGPRPARRAPRASGEGPGGVARGGEGRGRRREGGLREMEVRARIFHQPPWSSVARFCLGPAKGGWQWHFLRV
jgi:hypothetical protein